MQTKIETVAAASRLLSIDRSGLLHANSPLAFVDLELDGDDWTLYYRRESDGWACTPETVATSLAEAAQRLAVFAGEEAPLEGADLRAVEALVHAAASPALRRIERELGRLLAA
jgi:hypothetical protein